VDQAAGRDDDGPVAAPRAVIDANSAAEIAVEVSTVAERTLMSMRGGAHVIPRWIGRAPFDAGDVEPFNLLPWRLLNRIYRRRVAREIGAAPASFPAAAHGFWKASRSSPPISYRRCGAARWLSGLRSIG
jgi:hypothetical protein